MSIEVVGRDRPLSTDESGDVATDPINDGSDGIGVDDGRAGRNGGER